MRGRRRLDQQAVAVHDLARAAARRQVHEVLGLQHRLAVGVGRAVADVEDHGSSRERARTHLRVLLDQVEVAPADHVGEGRQDGDLLVEQSLRGRRACRPAPTLASAATSARRTCVSSASAMRCSSMRPPPSPDCGSESIWRDERGELEGDAARVALVDQQQVEHERQHRRQPVARAIGDEAVGQLQRERAGCRCRPRRRWPCRRCRAAARRGCAARDSRRPMSRNDQPKLRVMFSCVRPWKAASTRRPSSSRRSESPIGGGHGVGAPAPARRRSR